MKLTIANARVISGVARDFAKLAWSMARGEDVKIEFAFEELVAELKKKTEDEKITVPVSMAGFYVGMADLNADGSFTAEINASPQGLQLREILKQNRAFSVSINPNKPKGPENGQRA